VLRAIAGSGKPKITEPDPLTGVRRRSEPNAAVPMVDPPAAKAAPAPAPKE
jgi:hypothetical protein